MERAYKLLTLAFCAGYEGPVLSSPMVAVPAVCKACGVTFSPLVYLTGIPTYAQHSCIVGGGIYLASSSSDRGAGAFLGEGTIGKRIGADGMRAQWFQLDRVANACCWQCQRLVTTGVLCSVTPRPASEQQRLAAFCGACPTGTWLPWGDFALREGVLLTSRGEPVFAEAEERPTI